MDITKESLENLLGYEISSFSMEPGPDGDSISVCVYPKMGIKFINVELNVDNYGCGF